jgi:predicted RNA polymerase sigma factor
MNIKNTIPAAIVAAMLTTPAMACTDWKAIAALDAVIVASAQWDVEEMNRTSEKALNAGNKPSVEQAQTALRVYGQKGLDDEQVETDRKAALADKCQENAQ